MARTHKRSPNNYGHTERNENRAASRELERRHPRLQRRSDSSAQFRPSKTSVRYHSKELWCISPGTAHKLGLELLTVAERHKEKKAKAKSWLRLPQQIGRA